MSLKSSEFSFFNVRLSGGEDDRFHDQTEQVSRYVDSRALSFEESNSSDETQQFNGSSLISALLEETEGLTISSFVNQALSTRLDNQMKIGFDSSLALSATLINALPQLSDAYSLLALMSVVSDIRDRFTSNEPVFADIFDNYDTVIYVSAFATEFAQESLDELFVFNDTSLSNSLEFATLQNFSLGDAVVFDGNGSFLFSESQDGVEVIYGDTVDVSFGWVLNMPGISVDELNVVREPGYGFLDFTGVVASSVFNSTAIDLFI